MRETLLETITPFRFLAPELRARLSRELVLARYASGQTILRQGDEHDKRLFLLAQGTVETIDLRATPPKPLGVLQPGHFFGERAALFDQPRAHEVRALGEVVCYTLAPESFLALLGEAPAFAQQLGAILRDRRGIFAAFDRFRAELLQGVSRGEIALRQLLPLYRALEPALHPKLASAGEIDWSALSYAVRRLPHNVTHTLMYFLTDDLPEIYAELVPSFREVSTEARPRTVYELLPGKSMVLLRDGLSDLIDFATCLCLYAVEARKLRKRLRSPGALAVLHRAAPGAARVSGSGDDAHAFLGSLPFSAPEIERLLALWPEDAPARMRAIALHHEDYGLEIKKQVHNYNSAHAGRWTEQIARATRELIGCDPSALPPALAVHLISSNTHSVANCLSSYWPACAEEVLERGRWRRPDGGESFAETTDQVYALGKEHLALDPLAAAERERLDRESGMLRLEQSAFTGIQVELIDGRRLCGRPIDAGLPPVQPGFDALIVNVDFAFGQQAEEIIGNLIALFGRNIHSVNVLGKAGALLGRRGDILVPGSFLEQTEDLLLDLGEQRGLDLARLRARSGGRELRCGRMLTVAGTLLQNRMMLHYYRRIWGCAGLEMEGWFYLRKLREAQQLGLLRAELDLRFLYYVSDLPLEPEASLSDRLSAAEGIPPLYAITREILTCILERDAARATAGPRPGTADSAGAT